MVPASQMYHKQNRRRLITRARAIKSLAVGELEARNLKYRSTRTEAILMGILVEDCYSVSGVHITCIRTYARAVHTAQAYAMNDDFSRVLSQQIEYYSNDPNADRINGIKGELNQVRCVMIENIDKVLDRGLSVQDL